MVELHKGDKISNKINVLCASKVADGESARSSCGRLIS